MISLVLAVEEDICEETLEVGKNCTMLTPSINYCETYNYTIYNQSDFIRGNNLTLLNDSIYYLLFNETVGDYIVKLCDGSTREIIVEMEDNTMMSIAIVLSIFGILFILVGLILFYNKKHNQNG